MPTMMQTTTLHTALRELEYQRGWITQCGGDLAGYVAKYGSAKDPEHYGDGGEAIYAADLDTLKRTEALVEKLSHTPIRTDAFRLAPKFRTAWMRQDTDRPRHGRQGYAWRAPGSFDTDSAAYDCFLFQPDGDEEAYYCDRDDLEFAPE